MMDEIKPCPKCGGKAKYIYTKPFNFVFCKKCRTSSQAFVDSYEQGDGRDEAIRAWNRGEVNE